MSEPTTGAWRDSSNWRSRNAPDSGRNNFRPNRDRDGTASSSWRRGDADRGAPPPDGNNGRPRFDDWGYEHGTRPSDRIKTLGPSQGDEEASAKAISEGRRIYVGNLRYQAKPEDIEGLLKKNDLGHYTKIHISIDPFTGRNPSYCFVEFPDRESADRAMTTLEGKELLGREVKCRPCQPKGGHSRGRQFNEGMNRWGNWSGEDRRGERQGGGRHQRSSSPTGTPESFSRYRQDFTGMRLCVAGLPRMTDQATNFEEISGLFKGFKVEAISKRISAHEKWRSVPGNHDYCFVDFATPKQAQEAREAVDGTDFRGAPLKVSFAKGRSLKWQERDELGREK
ncbi:hypothetical protein F4809DRAFT_605189 [Biscogniauxia mediterranea]|nr:hypothetical protein F4809DRAFT_605189 [Biscogniauxia mediterranea]